MKYIKITIVIPVYNVENYIERCLLSVFRQTYKNLEVIIVDDCGSDSSMQIINDFLQKQTSETESIVPKIINHNRNRGLSAARNSGTIAATGDYIYYLDSDDELTLNCIENLVSLVRKYPKAEVVQGNMSYITNPPSTSVDWRDISYKNLPEYVDDKMFIVSHFFDYTTNNFIPVNACGKLIKRFFFIENELWFREGIIHEDEHWMFKMSECISSMAFSKDFTYIHYANEGSIMLSGSNRTSINSWAEILNDVYFSLKDPCLKLKRSYCISIVKDQYFRFNVDIEENNLIPKYKSLINNMRKFSFKKFDLVSVSLLTLLYYLPFSFRKNRVISRIFRKLFKQKTILSIMHLNSF